MPYLSQDRLKTQELEIAQQATIISQQGRVINRLQEALISLDRKCKPEVQETREIKSLLEFVNYRQPTHK